MAEITLPQITDTTVDGTGVFDTLMRSINAQLRSDAVKNKIKGPEYATVYLSSLQAALEMSLSFLVAQQKSEIVAQELILAQQEVLKIQAEIPLIAKQGQLIDAQIADTQGNAAIKVATVNKINAEIALLEERRRSESAQTQDGIIQNNSVLYDQRELYRAQTEGYSRDREQKAVKLLADIWTVERSTDDATPSTTYGFGPAVTSTAVDKLLTSHNLK